ncbi:amidohydrolase family protein [Kitasatospora terrestris]|uniref:Amidohydrolase family protein n=1 Tax=Kitasatospora terrestris TaxID=258051 RepID=A0ABP9E5Q7_9ACTN
MIDQHCHSVLAGDLDDAAFAALLTESDLPPAPGTSRWESSIGLAVRRWCAPALGLPALAEPADYLARRRELPDPAGTLLRAAGLDALLVDTGLTAAAGRPLLPLAELGAAAGARVREVVRLESVAERTARDAAGPAGWLAATAEALHGAAAGGAVAFKSVLAYRSGLAVPPEPPSAAEVLRAAGQWLRGPRTRLADPVLGRHLLWTALDCGLPIQFHTGLGDPDLRPADGDPALLADFLRTAGPRGVPVVLLHCYPYHRTAAWLAHCFPHVSVDVGLTLSHTGARAAAVLGEVLEVAPFDQVLFSTDAYGLPELYLAGAAQFRHALAVLLAGWQRDGACTAADAGRITRRTSGANARRLYRL